MCTLLEMSEQYKQEKRTSTQKSKVESCESLVWHFLSWSSGTRFSTKRTRVQTYHVNPQADVPLREVNIWGVTHCDLFYGAGMALLRSHSCSRLIRTPERTPQTPQSTCCMHLPKNLIPSQHRLPLPQHVQAFNFASSASSAAFCCSARA